MRPIPPILIAVGALLLALTVSVVGVAAQDEPMAAADHPLVGAWQIDPTPDDPSDPLELFTTGADGIVTYVAAEGSGVGSWVATGERSADARFEIVGVDPATGEVSSGTVRTSVEVAEDGQSFTGTYTFTIPPAFAEAMGLPVGEFGPGDVTGQRIPVEPMGEPVAPIPEFDEFEPPAGEMSPAPEASPAG